MLVVTRYPVNTSNITAMLIKFIFPLLFKLNKNIICKKLNKYNTIFNSVFRQNVTHFYNKL